MAVEVIVVDSKLVSIRSVLDALAGTGPQVSKNPRVEGITYLMYDTIKHASINLFLAAAKEQGAQRCVRH